MAFKFEGLEVWKLAMDYLDTVYAICEQLPRCEDYNLRSQMVRAGTSTVLAIAEGSTGQTDAEQCRFLGIGLRSVFETVACQHVIYRRRYLADLNTLRSAYRQAETLARKITALRLVLDPDQRWVRERSGTYFCGDPEPFCDYA